MFKSISILILLLVSISPLFSQWITNHYEEQIFLSDCFFIDSLSGYAAGNNGKILKTTDGGQLWDSLPSGTNVPLGCIYFINKDTGFTGGYYRILRTTNGGESWVTTFPGFSVWDIDFVNDTTGYIVGEFGSLYKTQNAGLTWNKIPGPFYLYTLSCIDFVNDSVGYIGSETLDNNFRFLYKTTNSGSNWTKFALTPCAIRYISASFLNNDTGFFACSEGKIVKTINGGENWLVTASFIEDLTDIQAVDYSNIYLTGTGSTIRKSEDGGFNWIDQHYPNSQNRLEGIYMLNSQTGYAVGDNGLIVKTTNGGGTVEINPTGNEIPSEFKLHQNYPNPFNPSTNIKFDIPKSSKVKLSVYNTLGKEVAVLVNEELAAGQYNLAWNGAGQSSGVYYYRLETEGFTEVRKMMLIK